MRVQQPIVQQVQQPIEVDEKKYYHCSKCVKSFPNKRDHKYYRHRDESEPEWTVCVGNARCLRCPKDECKCINYVGKLSTFVGKLSTFVGKLITKCQKIDKKGQGQQYIDISEEVYVAKPEFKYVVLFMMERE